MERVSSALLVPIAILATSLNGASLAYSLTSHPPLPFGMVGRLLDRAHVLFKTDGPPLEAWG